MKRTYSFLVVFLSFAILTGCTSTSPVTSALSFVEDYNSGIDGEAGYSYEYTFEPSILGSSLEFIYNDIGFSTENVIPEGSNPFTAKAAACYSVDDGEIIYGSGLFEKVYPASITKLLTAYTALLYSDMDDLVVIEEDNGGITTPGAQLCGFKAGDSLTMKNLLYCLLVYSGNDAASAIAKHISGSDKEFVALMNKQAKALGAIDTNFTNSHGLNDPNHYTTAYDMYLVFNECLKYDAIREIIGCGGCDIPIVGADGGVRILYMEPTNLYYQGKFTAPDGITVFGGKTGTTIAAGNCIILYSEDRNGRGYITELFKCDDKNILYTEMNELLKLCQ